MFASQDCWQTCWSKVHALPFDKTLWCDDSRFTRHLIWKLTSVFQNHLILQFFLKKKLFWDVEPLQSSAWLRKRSVGREVGRFLTWSWKMLRLGNPIPRQCCSSAGVEICSAWKNPKLSSKQEGPEPDAFWQIVCRKKNKTWELKDHKRSVYWSHMERLWKNSTLRHTLAQEKKKTQTERRNKNPDVKFILGISSEVLCCDFDLYSKIKVSCCSRTKRWELQFRLTHWCQKSIKQNYTCSPTWCYVREFIISSWRRQHFSNRWTKHRQKDNWNISKDITNRFLDCESNVNPGFTSEPLQAKIKHHVSSTVDDFGQEYVRDVPTPHHRHEHDERVGEKSQVA